MGWATYMIYDTMEPSVAQQVWESWFGRKTSLLAWYNPRDWAPLVSGDTITHVAMSALGAYVVKFALNLSWLIIFFTGDFQTALYVGIAWTVTTIVTTVLYSIVQPSSIFFTVPYLAMNLLAALLTYDLLELNGNVPAVRSKGRASPASRSRSVSVARGRKTRGRPRN